ncbi:MAG: FecR domain-containing protein [Planctomycetales bacterium]|nr:FecR domain-containing protein [Planctomycetales bacterium]
MNAQERFAELWTDYLEGELGEAGIAELRELLDADAALLKLATDTYQMHHLLGLVVEESPERQDKFVRDTLSRLPEESESFVGSVMDQLKNVGRTTQSSSESQFTSPAHGSGDTKRIAFRGVLAIVALSLLAIVCYSFWSGARPSITKNEVRPHDEATLNSDVRFASLAHAEFFGELLPAVNSVLTPRRDYVLMSGLVEVRFPAGASAILEGPAVFRVLSNECLALDVGRCSVHAPEGAEGFRVETPVTHVVDRGTRFTVSVAETSETEVQVIEGAADVYESSRDTSRGADSTADEIRLTDGEARKFANVQAFAADTISFDASVFRHGMPDRIVGYQAAMAEDGTVSELQSVTVQRGGRAQTFRVSDLIGVKVIHFRAGENNANVAVPVGYEGDRLAGLESDRFLHTGVLNPGGSVEPLFASPILAGDATDHGDSTPGMAVRFQNAIVNAAGPDVVFFELQTVVNPPNGDAFHVSPLRFDDGLRSLTIRKYDIAMTSREALSLPRFDLLFFQESATSVESLVTGSVDRRPQTLQFRALAVGIDLSDMGYADGATVEGLFFQDALDDKHFVDPVFIAGLPNAE